MDMIRRRLDWIGSKVGGLGVSLGLETAGNDRGFGTFGDIAILAGEYPFVRPIVDWAHVHAMTGGGLTSVDAFAAVLGFVRESFDAVKVSPLHCQFSDNLFGPHGEIAHRLRGGHAADRTARRGGGGRGHADGDHLRVPGCREPRGHRRRDAAGAWPERSVRPGRVSAAIGGAPATVRVEKTGERWKVVLGSRPLTVSNIDKPFFPDGITKGDLIQYYAAVADLLLPHLAERPLSMSRYPDGIDGPSFYEKRAPGHQPEWMTDRHRALRVDGRRHRVPAGRLPAGADVVRQHGMHRDAPVPFPGGSTSTIRTWRSSTSTRRKGRPGSRWSRSPGWSARCSASSTSWGSPNCRARRGLHVYVPLEPVHTHERVRRFVGAVGELLATANPDDVTMAWDIPKRKGRVFIDHNRNAFGQTIASVYSVRPRPGAPVSLPHSLGRNR
jgi:hypothetical protein